MPPRRLSSELARLEAALAAGAEQVAAEAAARVAQLEAALAAEQQRLAGVEAALAEAQGAAAAAERERGVLERTMGAEIAELQAALQVGGWEGVPGTDGKHWCACGVVWGKG